jgi:hypothetical protein
MLNKNYHDDYLFPWKILLKFSMYLLLGFVWFLMFWYSQFDIWNQNLHIFYVFQTLDLFKKLQEPKPPYPTLSWVGKAIGLWKNESNL